MHKKNHKPATTSDILPGTLSSEVLLTKEDPHSDILPPAPPINPQIQQSKNPFPSPATRARCGKVARLPKEIRDQLNEMLLDGVPHAQIIQKLKQSADIPADPDPDATDSRITHHDSEPVSAHPAPFPSDHASRITNHESPHPEHAPSDSIENQNGSTSLVSKIEILHSLTPHHITTWKKFGDYRDWLRDQQRIEECKLRHELTLDLARSSEGLASYQAAPKVAVAQICQTIIDLGPAGLKDAMKDSPLNCFRLLNALARLINSGLKCENQIQKTAIDSGNRKRGGLTRERLQSIEKKLNLM